MSRVTLSRVSFLTPHELHIRWFRTMSFSHHANCKRAGAYFKTIYLKVWRKKSFNVAHIVCDDMKFLDDSSADRTRTSAKSRVHWFSQGSLTGKNTKTLFFRLSHFRARYNKHRLRVKCFNCFNEKSRECPELCLLPYSS